MLKKKIYKPATISMVKIETTFPLLTGSITKTDVAVDNVAVEAYQPGFQDTDGNDFATISFD